MFDEHDLRNQTTLEEMPKFNVSVLVYPFHKAVHDGLRDVMFEGNYRHQCNLQFDCFFNQKDNHDVNAKLINSMDAIVVCNEGMNRFRKLFPSINKQVSK